jgi:Concanavalin A-like lectin/glucanases superfamily
VSIKTAMLALAPDLYWECADTDITFGALDSTVHARTGQFQSGTVLGVPGPEVGTLAIGGIVPSAGIQGLFTNPYVGHPAMSCMCWFTCGAFNAGNTILLYDGSSATTGQGLIVPSGVVGLLFGGIGINSTGAVVTTNKWHHFCLTISPGVSQDFYLDGVHSYTAAAGIPNDVVAGNPLQVFCPSPGLMAHVAFFAGALSSAQVATVHAARVNPQESTVTGRSASDIDVLALGTALATNLADLLAGLFRNFSNTP